MSQLHCNKKRKRGQHLTYEDRKILEYVCNQQLYRSKKNRWTQKQIAEYLEISEATLSRELRRGRTTQLDSNLETYDCYSARVAQYQIQSKWEKKGSELKIGRDHILAQIIESMLIGKDLAGLGHLRYSPEAIVMYFNQVGWPTETRLCARTIYNYVKQGVFLNVSIADLPRKGSKPKRRKRRIEKRLHPPEYKRIDERSEACQARSELGHWEMDCIESVKSDRSCLLTLVDRCSREVLIFKLGRQSQEAVQRRLNGLERALGTKQFRKKFKSITVDNGSEFLNWQDLERSVYSNGKRTQIYYAHAYSSWERGSNENLNHFIRYFISKGTPIKDIREREVKALEDFINHYPRKILDGRSAIEFRQAAA